MEKRKLWSYENALVTLFFFAIGFVFFDRLAINYLMPFMQKDFSLNNTQIGMLSSALAVTWAVSGPVVGYISDRVNSKKTVLVILILLFSCLSLLHGMVATFSVLLILRLLMGFAEGPIIPISSSILSAESSVKRRGFNLGIVNGTAYGVFGSFLAPLIIVALANTFDWRTAFYLTIIPGIMIAFLIAMLVKNRHRNQDKTAAAAAPQEAVSFKQVWRNRNIWLCLVIACSFWVFLLPFSIFAPLYLTEVKQLSPGTMSMVMAVFGAGSAIGGFMVPAISDRIGRKPIAVLFTIVAVFAPLTLLFADSIGLMAILIFVFSTANGVTPLMTSVIPTESIPAKFAAATMGIIIAGTEIVGGVLSPLFTGIAADVYGLAAPLWISAAGALLACLFALLLKESAPVKVRANQEIETAL